MNLSYFEVLAECSIAFAGFGAIHAALQGSDSPRGLGRAWVVVSQGALSFALSMLPLLMDMVPFASETMWQNISAIGVVGSVGLVYRLTTFDILMTRMGHPPQAGRTVRIAQFLSIVAVIAMSMNLIGWPREPGPFLYAIAVTFILFTGLAAFLHSFFLAAQIAIAGEDPEGPPAS